MKILVIGDPHGYSKYKESVLKQADIILVTGDLGKADFARKFYFDNLKRKAKGLEEKEYTKKETKAVYKEIVDSTSKVARIFSKYSPTYSILGNVGTNMIKNSEVKKDEKKYKIRLPYLKEVLTKLGNFSLIKNRVRRINGLKVGFLEFFDDTNWVRDFKPKDYNEKLKEANKETAKANKILRRFGKNLDILICHQPPYGFLDKVSSKYNPPKSWVGKHAGSKVILEYIKKKQPKYVFCGHIHEAKGKAKIGKTEVYNVGHSGDYKIIEIK